MDVPGVKTRRVITQPVEERETVAGLQRTSPFINTTETVKEFTDISIRKSVNSQLSVDDGASASGITAPSSNTCSPEYEIVVDMQQTRQLQNCVNIRQPGLLEKDLSISVRVDHSSCSAPDDLVDLQMVEEIEECDVEKGGSITYGDDADVIELLNEVPTQRGVFCQKQQVLQCENGMYVEGQQYKIIPGTQSKGAFGEAAMCQDLKTNKTFMRKTVKGRLSRNEIEVPLMFKGNVGIPEVFGVNVKDQDTEIFQEFAGLSLKMLMESGSRYARELSDPKMVMVLAFQAFATLHKLHSQGVTHQDIKPENLCLDVQQKGIYRLKFIDFGSSQTPKDQVIEGLTNEYLSPESCTTILQIATEKLPKSAGRLGPGTDIWALALSLLYCLCGYHVMVYVCTGSPRYLEQDPSKLQYLRMQCLLKICNLKDEDVMRKLIRPEWPEALKILLLNTLRVNPAMRWSAKDAAEFLRSYIIGGGAGAGVQPQMPSAEAPQAALTTPVAVAPPPAVATTSLFKGLAPSRLVIRNWPLLEAAELREPETSREVQAVQCSSPSAASAGSSMSTTSSLVDPPSPTQLPAFTDLLSNNPTSKPKRRSRGKQRVEPYQQSARRGSKK